jgi:hypothetical protein
MTKGAVYGPHRPPERPKPDGWPEPMVAARAAAVCLGSFGGDMADEANSEPVLKE